jgi:hypothetical protein
MADVTIEHLEITIEVDHTEGETAFAHLFQKYMRRWTDAERHRRADREFAEHERTVPGTGRHGQ